MKIPYIAEVVVKGIKNEIGQEVGLLAEVFPNKDKVKELNIENLEETLKKDISKATKELPTFKRISKIEIRESEFAKTTTNKIKR
jgi:long-chain acyl-CoA synthetase